MIIGREARTFAVLWKVVFVGSLALSCRPLALSSSARFAPAELSQREEEGPGGAARGCPGAQGEPGPKGARGAGHPGQLPFGGTAPGLPAFCENEVNTPH